MIANHHKITRVRVDADSLVEAFRRADWVDVSRGFRRFGVARPFIKSLFATWPSAGFSLAPRRTDRRVVPPASPDAAADAQAVKAIICFMRPCVGLLLSD
jgi:hypothetical protein